MGTQPPDIDIMGRYWNTTAGAGCDGMTQKGILEILQQAIERAEKTGWYRVSWEMMDIYIYYIYYSYINNYIYNWYIDSIYYIYNIYIIYIYIRMHYFEPWPCLKMLGKKRGLKPFWFRGVEESLKPEFGRPHGSEMPKKGCVVPLNWKCVPLK